MSDITDRLKEQIDRQPTSHTLNILRDALAEITALREQNATLQKFVEVVLRKGIGCQDEEFHDALDAWEAQDGN